MEDTPVTMMKLYLCYVWVDNHDHLPNVNPGGKQVGKGTQEEMKNNTSFIVGDGVSIYHLGSWWLFYFSFW